MAEKTDDRSIYIDLQLVNSTAQKVCSLQDSGSWKDGPRTIHRVPLNIRKGDTNAYEPKILSIGPYHRGDQKLQAMEVHKMRYLRELLGSNLEANITKCVEKIKKLEKEARRCYSEIIELGSKEFVEMMLLDGCFIIQFLIQRNQPEESKQKRRQAGDPIYVVSWMSPLIRHDLLMLENQIPFIILKAIFDVVQSSRQETPSLMELALNYITHGRVISRPIYPSPPHHLLHLFHLFHSCVLTPPRPPASTSDHPLVKFFLKFMPQRRTPSDIHFTEERTPRTIPCASELREAGVRFEMKESDSFLDVTFSNPVLQIPLLSVGNSLNPLLRNLIAFEQCCPDACSYFTSYAVLMDDLINTPRDVAILHSRGIVENKLGSDEDVALLFNRLMTHVTFTADSNIYAELFKQVNAHCGSKLNKWRAKLVREYFSNPWSIISLLAAIALLVLTIIQTVFSITSYYHVPTHP
ncbi:UPF0481 protein At3g47200-like [Phoenix dactylifera]|uniref:UPF0481 protein At3g47200-like n=1 Tax=Phoenix dactylifera TaxID=42345 RepID=A0A8B7BM35_PHODC|nr:UPF0481 protein At3g47200-like [Phoenix dactylifera]